MESSQKASASRSRGAKFAPYERVSIRVKDVNGLRGGIDRLCRINVVLNDLPSVVFVGI